VQKVQLEIKTKDLVSQEKLNNNRLRKDGWVPAVMYGHGDPMAIVIDAKLLNKAIHSEAGTNALFNLSLGGKGTLAIIKEIQRDIFTRLPIHIDFQRISEKEKIELNVAIHTKGEAKGVKEQGGILEHILRELHIRCLPENIPAFIEVDVTNLETHQGVKVSELVLPEGVEVLTAGDHTVVNIVIPRVEEVPVAAPITPAEGVAAAPGAEPEVIAKGKKEEEGAEAPAAGQPAGAGKPGGASKPTGAAKPAKEEKK